MNEKELAIVIISNGPGELSTWVRPVANELHKKLLMKPQTINSNISLKLVLVPCPNATGHEKLAAQKWNLFERIYPAEYFWHLLLRPRKYCDWPKKGLVIFLGGDQFWSVLLSARLRYLNMTYAEWVIRWPYWNDRIMAMTSKVIKNVPKSLEKRCKVVGDLMADVNKLAITSNRLPNGTWVALMPGSKSAKLKVGIPFFLEVADKLLNLIPNCKFIIPIAPTTSIEEFKEFSSTKNSIANKYKSGIDSIIQFTEIEGLKKLITTNNTEIYLQENFPAHDALSQCSLALTTIGANTAELGALAIPMIVVVPTQHLQVMKAWDGFLGVLGRMPFLNWVLGKIISVWRMRKNRFMAWPNITANRMIVPERIGQIVPSDIAKEASEWLKSPMRLKGVKEDLQNLRGNSGASKAIANETLFLINQLD